MNGPKYARQPYTNPDRFPKAEPLERPRYGHSIASPRSKPLKERKRDLARKLAKRK